ncbi:MAG: hypothetical protein L0Y66_12065 [Myxococcaceae bacterium]|nr:hypothetical protein [Myxococcaceae bacterium]MCI0673535.1 hypothetical protein [Myxococcaceae bacterium]
MARVEDLEVGMTVYSADGHRLGRVLAVAYSQFQVEKGLVFHRDFLVNFGDVADVRGRQVLLRQKKDDIPGVEGGFADKGYSDRGLAGDRGTVPLAGVGAGLAPHLGAPTRWPTVTPGELPQRFTERAFDEDDERLGTPDPHGYAPL